MNEWKPFCMELSRLDKCFFVEFACLCVQSTISLGEVLPDKFDFLVCVWQKFTILIFPVNWGIELLSTCDKISIVIESFLMKHFVDALINKSQNTIYWQPGEEAKIFKRNCITCRFESSFITKENRNLGLYQNRCKPVAKMSYRPIKFFLCQSLLKMSSNHN